MQGRPRFFHDYVPTAELTWSDVCISKAIKLQRSHGAGSSVFKHLLAQMSSDAQTLCLNDKQLQPQRVTQPAGSFLVWRASPAGCTVKQGTIALPKDNILLVAGHGAHFKDATFSGGVLMCAGPDFSGTFTDCVFDDCTLYAVHGACLALRRCRFIRGAPAFVASGGDTTVHLSGCLFHACRAGLIADRGATVGVIGSGFINNTTSIILNDPGTHAEVERSTAQIMAGVADPLAAVVAGQAATARLLNCHVSGAKSAVHACGRAAVEVFQTSVLESRRAVIVEQQSRAAIREVNISTSTCTRTVPGATGRRDADSDGCGVTVRGHGSVGALVQMLRCCVRGDRRAGGVSARDGGRVEALLCDMTCMLACAAASGAGSAMWLRCSAMSSSSPDPDCLVCMVMNDGAVLSAEGCSVDSQRGFCAAAVSGVLAFSDCKLSGGAASAKAIKVQKSKLALLRCHVGSSGIGVLSECGTSRIMNTELVVLKSRGGHRAGVKPTLSTAVRCSGGSLSMVGGQVQGHIQGVVAFAKRSDGMDMSLWLEGVYFNGCAQCVDCFGPVAAKISGCRFAGCSDDAAERIAAAGPPGLPPDPEIHPGGVSLAGVRSSSVRDCVFAGPWAAVVSESTAPVHVKNCRLQCARQEKRPFVKLGKAKGAVVEDCDVAGSECGVFMSEAGHAVVRRCKFDCVSGVRLSEWASLQLIDCTVRGADVGMHLVHHCKLVVQDCECRDCGCAVRAEGGAIMLSASRLRVLGAQTGVRASCMMDHLPPSVVSLADCTLEGADITNTSGVWAGRVGIEVSLLRCELSGFGVAMSVVGSCRVKLHSSCVRSCMVGVMVGQHRTDSNAACHWCSLAGEIGHMHAMQALLQSQVQSAAGARCVHEGAVARAVLEDVTVEKCVAGIGVVVNADGHMDATRLSVLQCGLEVTWAAEESRFEDCVVPDRKQVKMRFWQRGLGELGVGVEDVPGLRVQDSPAA